VNITKARLEGLFVDEWERFQPTPGYMRLRKESVLRVWHERKASVKNEVASAEHRAKAIQQKLDPLDDAFIYKESIDLGTYERNAIGFAKNSRWSRSTGTAPRSRSSTSRAS
jgi:hypothetical protein